MTRLSLYFSSLKYSYDNVVTIVSQINEPFLDMYIEKMFVDLTHNRYGIVLRIRLEKMH